MTELYFTSDLHFGHLRIAELSGRPFPHGLDGVDMMREALVLAWNTTVGPDAEVWVLGDFAMGRIDDSLPVVARLNGTVRLVMGNHDRPWCGSSPARRIPEWTERYLDAGFASVHDDAVCSHPAITAVTEGGGVRMCHFPYAGDSHGEDRFVHHRPDDDGQWLLHGHVHETWRQHNRQINVGVDAWAGHPVAVEEIAELIAAGPADRAPLGWDEPFAHFVGGK